MGGAGVLRSTVPDGAISIHIHTPRQRSPRAEFAQPASCQRNAIAMDRSKLTATPDQLRHDIDSGRTGDKVRASDPAAAPLCTDEEAAGTSIAPELVAKVRDSERQRALRLGDPADAEKRDFSSAIAIWLAAVLLGYATAGTTVLLTRW